MSALIKDLLRDKNPPVTITMTSPVSVALDRMWMHDYSQLPVVDDDNRPIGLLTDATVVRALRHLRCSLEQLTVADALEPRSTKNNLLIAEDAEVFDILDRFERTPALLVRARNGDLVGIVTAADVIEHLRQQSQDITLVRDIEAQIKDYIELALRSSNDEDEDEDDKLKRLIADIDSRKSSRQPFKAALVAYLQEKQQEPDGPAMERAFQGAYMAQPKDFNHLSMNEYIDLLLHKDSWALYEQIFAIDQRQLRDMLNRVRQVRNDLSHLRVELAAEKRDLLRYCRDWLNARQDEMYRRFADADRGVDDDDSLSLVPQTTARDDNQGAAARSLMHADRPGSGAPGDRDERSATSHGEPGDLDLASFLEQASAQEYDKLQLTFDKLEAFMGELPGSARLHRSWWSNSPETHPQSRAWLDANWRVSRVNTTSGKVTFVSIEPREQAFIDFFSGLLEELRARSDWDRPVRSPRGKHVLIIDSLYDNGQRCSDIRCGFSRSDGFRISLYLFLDRKQRSSALYDRLEAHRDEIEIALGESLHWQRGAGSRTSRVSLVYPDMVSIADEDKFPTIYQWTASRLRPFYNTFESFIQKTATTD